MRASTLVALLGMAACALGTSRAADATSVNLRWFNASGAVTGLGTNTVTVASAPATLTLDIRIDVDAGGLSAAFLSLEFDRDLRNELNIVSFQELGWTGVMMTSMALPRLDPFSLGLLTSQESSASQTGLLYTFDVATTSTAADCCPVSTTIAFARVVFQINPSNLARDGGDIFAYIFNPGVDGIFNQAGGNISPFVFLSDTFSFARVNSTGAPPTPVKSLYADFDGNLRSDILLLNSSTRQLFQYLMNASVNPPGTAPLSTSSNGPLLPSNDWQLVAIADVSGDGQADLITYNTVTRLTYFYKMSGTTVIDATAGPSVPAGWVIAGVGDFNGDGLCDLLLLQTGTGLTYQLTLDFRQNTVVATGFAGPTLGNTETIVALARFNGDATDDILSRDSAGLTRQYYLNAGGAPPAGSGGGIGVLAGWAIRAVGNFDGAGGADILIVEASTGIGFIYLQNGLAVLNSGSFNRAQFLPAGWTVGTVGDFDADGNTDVVVRQTSNGRLYLYRMSGLSALPTSGVVATPGSAWTVPVSGPVHIP